MLKHMKTFIYGIMQVKFYPVIQRYGFYMPLWLPDVIDIHTRHGYVAIYFYPASSWSWTWGFTKGDSNDFTLLFPTMLIEYRG